MKRAEYHTPIQVRPMPTAERMASMVKDPSGSTRLRDGSTRSTKAAPPISGMAKAAVSQWLMAAYVRETSFRAAAAAVGAGGSGAADGATVSAGAG